LHAPFVLGLITGGAVIYWFTGASTQAVTTGAYRAVEFIKANIRLEGVEKASVEDSKKVVQICTQYAQKGMFNIFMVLFFSTLGFACLDSFFFIGYLISIALFGLYQAIFMANAGGAWDNAKKVVETELRAKGTELHAATVVGDTVGDPFKDTSSVALNPVIKFTTLFGVLAVSLANEMHEKAIGYTDHSGVVHTAVPVYDNIRWIISGVCLFVAMVFAWRSFYGMRITSAQKAAAKKPVGVSSKAEADKAAAKDEKKIEKAVEKAEERKTEAKEEKAKEAAKDENKAEDKKAEDKKSDDDPRP